MQQPGQPGIYLGRKIKWDSHCDNIVKLNYVQLQDIIDFIRAKTLKERVKPKNTFIMTWKTINCYN